MLDDFLAKTRIHDSDSDSDSEESSDGGGEGKGSFWRRRMGLFSSSSPLSVPPKAMAEEMAEGLEAGEVGEAGEAVDEDVGTWFARHEYLGVRLSLLVVAWDHGRGGCWVVVHGLETGI